MSKTPEPIIDLSSLLGEFKVHERTVHGRTVRTADIPAKDIVQYEKIFGRLTFDAVVSGTRVILQNAAVEGDPKDEEFEAWFDSIPYDEAVHLVLQQLDPELPDRDDPWDKPSTIRIRKGLDIVIPAFTLGDAVMFRDTLEARERGGSVMLERVEYIFSRCTLANGKPLPKDTLSTLKRNELAALIDFYINRTVQQAEGNA